MNILRLYHTVKYLKPVQVTSRVWKKIYRPGIPLLTAPACRELTTSTPISWCRRNPSLTDESTFCFLNTKKTLIEKADWQSLSSDKLWMYNLHYFDDLAATDAISRASWHQRLLQRWIEECPPGRKIAWDPYPMSLRIVNWIKYLLRQEQPDPALLDSLATQSRALRQNLEWHLLGNHLFANAKALIFAGVFFNGSEANAWRHKGEKIMQSQLKEQVLADGGQFERSPMYHCILLEDILDLIQLDQLYPKTLSPNLTRQLRDCAHRMLSWLEVMTRPNGEIVQFNDAAQGIAAEPAWLYHYANQLAITWHPRPQQALIQLPDTGYIRCTRSDLTLFLDVAPIGPDYIPGHAHADSLNFELHVGDEPIIVDSGTSVYGISNERHRQRATAAHNTIEVDGYSSSEVWGGFRVARRAYTTINSVTEHPTLTVDAQHDGYQTIARKSLHRRKWVIGERCVEISDELPGRFKQAIARFHLHPDIRIEQLAADHYRLTTRSHRQLTIHFDSGSSRLVKSTYHPEFGIALPNHCIEAILTGISLTTWIELARETSPRSLSDLALFGCKSTDID